MREEKRKTQLFLAILACVTHFGKAYSHGLGAWRFTAEDVSIRLPRTKQNWLSTGQGKKFEVSVSGCCSDLCEVKAFLKVGCRGHANIYELNAVIAEQIHIALLAELFSAYEPVTLNPMGHSALRSPANHTPFLTRKYQHFAVSAARYYGII